MNRTQAYHSRARRGTVMVIVLGLITIMLGLALGLTVKVYMGMKGGVVTQQNAQAWIMMQAARMGVTQQPGVFAAGVTAGDLSAAELPPGKGLADRLGWVRIKPNAPDYHIIACGGSSGAGGTKAAANDGDAVRNAMDVRYLYTMSAAGSVTLQAAQPDHYADKW